MNRLPEKLTLLRKYNEFSQGDVAKHLNVPVTEYMNWENGNCICHIEQLKMLAEMYGVTIDSLLDNKKTIIIPEEELAKSAEIPSFSNNAAEKTQEMGKVSDERTIQMGSVGSDDLGETKVVSQAALQDEDAGNDIEDVEEEDDEPEIRKKPDFSKLKNIDPSKKKKTTVLVGGVIGIVLVIAVVLLLLNGSYKVALSKDNRIAVGDTYTLYVDQNEKLNTYGNSTVNETSGIVQASAFEDHSALLTSKGKVVDNLVSDTSSWKKVDYIAAGKTHTAAVTEDGKVLCAGSDQACKVDSWANIATVYAGNDITVGVTNDGKVKVSGNTEALSSITGVRDIAISSQMIAVAKNDGTVVTSMLSSGTPMDTSSWADIRTVACGTDLVVGLTTEGSVYCESTDDSIKEAVSGWKNIRYISACGNTVVAIDRSGNMHGAGDNTYNQYSNDSKSDDSDESSSSSSKQLDEPQNITVSETTANVVIKWDTVKNADSYNVSISEIGDLPKTKTNQASVSASSFKDGETYSITVTAQPKSGSKTKEASATISYTYEAKKVQLTTPSGITASTGANGWTIQWSEVDHADYYEISLDGGDPMRANINSYVFDSSQIISMGDHTITIKAYSVNSTYTESEEGTGVVQYVPQEKNVAVMYIQGENTYVESGNLSVDVYVGMDYTYRDLDAKAGGFAAAAGKTLKDPDGTVHIYDSTSSIQIYLNDTSTEGQ